MKKTLSIILTILMIVTMIPFTPIAFAAEGDITYVDDLSYVEHPGGWDNDSEEALNGIFPIGTQDEGKTEWKNGDKVTVSLASDKYDAQSATLTYDGAVWTSSDTLSYLKNETPTVTAVYTSSDTLGLGEFIFTPECTLVDNALSINFEDAIRTHSRLRIATLAGLPLTVTVTGFTPAGAEEAGEYVYTLTADDNGNAYLYGIFAVGATVSVKNGNIELVNYTFTAEDYPNGTEQDKSYALQAGLIIDGTLGGKTTATEDDVNALVEKLKGYVDSGITTIIVTGSEPALHNFYDIDTPAVSAALYYLADNNYDSPYCGTIDLILPDVTEIVDDEFNNTFALNSITLPKVTKLGDLAFYACCFIQTIAFGSVVTDVEEGGGVMFAVVGQEVGGCDLILNCGQMNSSYIPDLDTNTWKFRYENEFKSITLTHTGGEATCIAKAVCETCGEEYGEFDANKHTLVQKDAKAPTCTEIGWDAYESCTECDYTTYEVLPADPDAHNFEDGKCECGYVCTHETYSEGVCVNCGEVIYTYDEATDTYTVYTFAALKAALTAGGNIILGADIIRENTKDITAVPENITAVLDLNGKTITSAPAVPGVNYEIICVNGNLTIKDSDTNGTITANSVISCIYVEGGNLTIEAGNFICDPDLSYAVDVYSGNAVINGGTFTNFNVFDEGKAVINGGEFQNYIGTSGSVIINGGTFYGVNSVYGGGTFDIYGGEFHEDPSEYVANGYEAVANENGTWTVVCAHTDKLVQVDAKAPTCTEIGWEAYEYCTACDYTTYEVLPAITHIDANCDYKCDYNCGYVYETLDFSDAKVLTTNEKGILCIDGVQVKYDTYTVTSTYFMYNQYLPSGKYKLSGDVTVHKNGFIYIKEGENVSVDLNGYTWNCNDCTYTDGTFSVYDTSKDEKGKITSPYYGQILIRGDGEFNLYSGTIENSKGGGVLRVVEGTANLYGGKLKSNEYIIEHLLYENAKINLGGTVLENEEGYPEIISFIASSEVPQGVINVADYTGESLTVEIDADYAGTIKILEGVENAQEAEKYTIKFYKNDFYYLDKTEYNEETGEMFAYTAKYAFTQQPSAENGYTVDFNNSDATFQWYEVEETILTPDNVTAIDEVIFENEKWLHGGWYVELFTVDVEAGDMITVSTTSARSFDLNVHTEDYSIEEYVKATGKASVTIDSDAEVIVGIDVDVPNETTEFEIELIRTSEMDETETDKTLQNPECGKTYVCKTSVGETVYLSDVVTVGHNIVSVDAKAPTCTEIGWDAYEYCTKCNYTTYKELPASHNIVTVDAEAPTCTEIGWEDYEYCTRCNYTTYEEIPVDPEGHVLRFVTYKAPTCTEVGWEDYEYCTKCDYTTYKEIPVSHNIVTVDAKTPTCTEAGWDAYEYCTACTYTTYVEKEALKHSFTKYEITEEAKCGVAGKEAAYCDNGCGEADEKEIEALTHTFTKYEVTEEAKCGVAGKEVAYCDNGCGGTDEKAIDALTHKDADGDYKCDNGCGYEYEKPAPEDPTPDTPDEPNTPDEPDTPDEPTDSTCDHLCHKSGFIGFIWKIVQFFSKLFKINPVCECGVAHY